MLSSPQPQPALRWQRVPPAAWPGLAPYLHAWNRRADGRPRCLHSDQGPDASAHAAELAALATDQAAFWLGTDAVTGAPAGVIGCEVDHAAQRVWLRGPLAAMPAWLDAMPALSTLTLLAQTLPQVRQWDAFVAEDDAALNAWYRAAGFEPQQLHRVLQAPAAGLAALPPLPQVRAATAQDRALAWALHSALFPSSYLSADDFGADASRRALWVVPGDDGGAIAGYLHAEDQPPGDELYVDYLGVVESARGRGLGAALLQRAGQGAVERGRTQVALTVREDRRGALGLYLRCGFAQVSAGRHWQRMGA
jgi:ribosomal protein S18 acetylase RimI-like enzyme